jgi:hypothetical protein
MNDCDDPDCPMCLTKEYIDKMIELGADGPLIFDIFCEQLERTFDIQVVVSDRRQVH